MSGRPSPQPAAGRLRNKSSVGHRPLHHQQQLQAAALREGNKHQGLSPPRSELLSRKAHDEAAAGEDWLSMLLHSPYRSQSFRHHRARPGLAEGPATAAGGRSSRGMLDGGTPERRRSTPTMGRRSSMQQRGRAAVAEQCRLDAWPQRKPVAQTEEEERLLQLPDYTRVRQFNIDARGAVVSRGDSFRRKKTAGAVSEADRSPPEAVAGEEPPTAPSRGSSVSSCAPPTGGRDSVARQPETADLGGQEQMADEGPGYYKICVLGQSGTGKRSLVAQFLCASAAFSDDSADDGDGDSAGQQQPQGARQQKCVSVNIGGHECDLQFEESDPQQDQTGCWLSRLDQFHAVLLVYSIDRRSSFRVALKALDQLRSGQGRPLPVILVANKADLERKRAVLEHEVKSAVLTYDVPHFEVSVALNLDVDDLLVGIVAQIKQAFRMDLADVRKAPPPSSRGAPDSDFNAAIRRFSQRKKRQMGIAERDPEGGKCTNLFQKLRRWHKGASDS